MGKYKSPGRPSLGKDKKPSRHIISDNDIEIFLHDHPEINASEAFQNTIRSMMPHGPDEIRLESLKKRKSEIERELNGINPEISRLEERIHSQKRIRLEAALEADYEAWYLRHMVQAGIFHILKVQPPNIEQTISDWISERKVKPAEIVEKSGEKFLSKDASLFLKIHLERLKALNGRKIIQPRIWSYLSPSESDFQVAGRYNIRFDYGAFQSDWKAGKISSELPVSFFKSYKPKIFDQDLKREIKKMMEPEYMEINDISLESM